MYAGIRHLNSEYKVISWIVQPKSHTLNIKQISRTKSGFQIIRQIYHTQIKHLKTNHLKTTNQGVAKVIHSEMHL